jgi:GntR family transcriptional repressor for pyruvate dehydrogenase complex
MESRKIVEKSIFKLAVERATKQDIKRIEEALDKLKEAIEEDKENITDISTDVHFAISQAAHNEILVGLLKQLSPMIVEKIEQMNISPSEDYELHKELVEGIKSRQPKEAEKVILEHLEYMEDKFLDNFKKVDMTKEND